MLASFAAVALFFAIVLLSGFVWNRAFDAVPRGTLLLMTALVCVYQAPTLFTRRVDVPGDLAFKAYPWKAVGAEGRDANTGIVLTQMVPWTEAARRDLRAGELPLWNRALGGGSPLLASLQNSIFHPFTLAGLFLPIGKAWTLSVCLRLFFCLVFFRIFLARWGVREEVAIFGAIAFTFSTFNVVALHFPLGLSMMTLPLALVAADEALRRPRWRGFWLVAVTLAMAILGGHPESAAWVALTTAAYALYLAAVLWRGKGRTPVLHGLGIAAAGAVAAALLTSPVWFPTMRILPLTERFHVLANSAEAAKHVIGADWMLPLVAPNVLGTPQAGNYRAPEPRNPTVLDDYGEVASGYAGLLTLALALAACAAPRRRPFWFFAGAMVIAFLTIYEVPVWYPALRRVPWIGIALHQRWRFLWVFGAAGLASLALDALLADASRARFSIRGAAAALSLLVAVYAFRWQEFAARHITGFEMLQFAIAALSVVAGVVAAVLFSRRRLPPAALAAICAAATFVELGALTWQYNPSADAARMLPATGAIRMMQSSPRPYRIVALGWSFLPDIPGYYGLEDLKTTDVVQYRQYLRLFRGWLAVVPNDFTQPIGRVDTDFVDFLNVRFVYVPPGMPFRERGFQRVYDGPDGAVFRNLEEIPRYFFARRWGIDPDFDRTVARLKTVADFSREVWVDHVPDRIRTMAGPALRVVGEEGSGEGGSVRVVRYGSRTAELEIESHGWNLLASSDVSMPGWRAYWNGRRLPPVVVNGAFIGSFVPPGKGTLVLRYLPEDFEKAARAAGATGVLLLVASALSLLRRRRRARDAV